MLPMRTMVQGEEKKRGQANRRYETGSWKGLFLYSELYIVMFLYPCLTSKMFILSTVDLPNTLLSWDKLLLRMRIPVNS
jgi:hypothetical protein